MHRHVIRNGYVDSEVFVVKFSSKAKTDVLQKFAPVKGYILFYGISILAICFIHALFYTEHWWQCFNIYIT